MGQRVPVPDERTQQTIDMLKMTQKDLGKMYKRFLKHDKDKSGEISAEEMKPFIEELCGKMVLLIKMDTKRCT